LPSAQTLAPSNASARGSMPEDVPEEASRQEALGARQDTADSVREERRDPIAVRPAHRDGRRATRRRSNRVVFVL
jgi:hypothetical protein